MFATRVDEAHLLPCRWGETGGRRPHRRGEEDCLMLGGPKVEVERRLPRMTGGPSGVTHRSSLMTGGGDILR